MDTTTEDYSPPYLMALAFSPDGQRLATSGSSSKVGGPDGYKGGLITIIIPGSPAERAGLKPGDIILTFNGHPVVQTEVLAEYAGAIAAGTPVTLEVVREGRPLNIQLTVE